MEQQFPQRTCGVPGLQLNKVSEGEKMELDGEQTTLFRQCVGSLIHVPEDRMDIKHAVKQLAKKLGRPRACDLG
eukprot:6596699-Alexandrium_andersonii.AAC.1